jgi:hypothetical protein
MGICESLGRTGVFLSPSFLWIAWFEPLCFVSMIMSEVCQQEYSPMVPNRNASRGKKHLLRKQSLGSLAWTIWKRPCVVWA